LLLLPCCCCCWCLAVASAGALLLLLLPFMLYICLLLLYICCCYLYYRDSKYLSCQFCLKWWFTSVSAKFVHSIGSFLAKVMPNFSADFFTN
jgi:hypothetical protein